MMLSRAPAAGKGKAPMSRAKKANTNKLPTLDQFIKSRDYTGSLALLEFNRKTSSDNEVDNLMWIGYCAFHHGSYQRAQEAYQECLQLDNCPPEVHLFLACSLYYMQMYQQAQEEASKGPDNALKNRILFHVSHKLNDETKLMIHHQKLSDVVEDQLSLAAIHYQRSHFQEATDIYKRQLLENRDDIALNVYVAMCYYKLDYYDVSLEILAVYLQAHPDSVVAVNLKACNHFRLYNGKAAEAELKALADQGHNLQSSDLIRHNLVVFNNGDGALQRLPVLIDYIPEARLNLVIYYLRHGGVQEAYDLIKDLEPATPQEYILKGVVNASVGQKLNSREHLKMAQQYFQLVGASASECDTIPGRQCMASCFFLLKQFEDVNIYLNSVKAYMYNDDDFNWNFALCQASNGNYKAAEEAFLSIQNEMYKTEYIYVAWLCRCYVMNGNPRNAWDVYLKMDSSAESFNLLQLIANDCYRMGQFVYAAKAFDVLERLDPDPEYWEGKRGACVGVFQMVVASKASGNDLREVLGMLRNNSNPQVEYMVGVIKKWCADNGMALP